MCDIWKRKPEGELTLEEIEQFFQKNNRFSWVNLTGGEMFLRKDAYDIIESILRNCKGLFLLDFPTNGIIKKRTVETVKKTLALRPKRLMVTVSIDGPPDLHDEIRGVRGAWHKSISTYKALRELQQKNYQVFLGMTLIPKNFDQIEATIEAVRTEIKDMQREDFHINIGQESGHYYENTGLFENGREFMRQSLESFVRLKKRSFHPVSLLEDRYQNLAKEFIGTGKSPVPCQALSSSCFVDSFGFVYPCSIYDTRVANIRDNDYSLKNIWKSTRVRKLRKEILGGDCPQCWSPCEAYQTILGNLFHPKVLMK